jgi:hypothetical protein
MLRRLWLTRLPSFVDKSLLGLPSLPIRDAPVCTSLAALLTLNALRLPESLRCKIRAKEAGDQPICFTLLGSRLISITHYHLPLNTCPKTPILWEPACLTLPIHLKSIDLLLAPASKTTTMFWIKQCSRISNSFCIHLPTFFVGNFSPNSSVFLCYKSYLFSSIIRVCKHLSALSNPERIPTHMSFAVKSSFWTVKTLFARFITKIINTRFFFFCQKSVVADDSTLLSQP